MRVMLLAFLVTFAFTFHVCNRSAPAAFVVSGPAAPRLSVLAATTKPDFDHDIKPIFQARCQPCHFQGGKVYDKLPFDRAETIRRLGTKLFTRIKDEKEQKLIREFLQ